MTEVIKWQMIRNKWKIKTGNMEHSKHQYFNIKHSNTQHSTQTLNINTQQSVEKNKY